MKYNQIEDIGRRTGETNKNNNKSTQSMGALFFFFMFSIENFRCTESCAYIYQHHIDELKQKTDAKTWRITHTVGIQLSVSYVYIKGKDAYLIYFFF